MSFFKCQLSILINEKLKQKNFNSSILILILKNKKQTKILLFLVLNDFFINLIKLIRKLKKKSLDHFSFKCIYFSLNELVKSIKRFYLFIYYQTILNHDLSLKRALPKKKKDFIERERMRWGWQFGADPKEGGRWFGADPKERGRLWFWENGTQSQSQPILDHNGARRSRPQWSSPVLATILA